MLTRRFHEIIMTNEQFRLLVTHIDLKEYETCEYTAITPEECNWYEYEDEKVDILHRLFMREDDMEEMLDDMGIVVNIITEEDGYSAARDLETLREDIIYELRMNGIDY